MGATMTVPTFPISFPGTKFICNLEGFKDRPYKDTGGLWTIGFGTRIADSDLEKYEKGISRDTGMFLFSSHNEKLQKELSKTPLVSLGFQHQKDAIFSLAYNLGFTQFVESTIYKHLVTRDVDVAPWLWYDKDDKGHVVLTRRRKLELRLFIYGDYRTD